MYALLNRAAGHASARKVRQCGSGWWGQAVWVLEWRCWLGWRAGCPPLPDPTHLPLFW